MKVAPWVFVVAASLALKAASAQPDDDDMGDAEGGFDDDAEYDELYDDDDDLWGYEPTQAPDPCHEHHYDCGACTAAEAGCLWCPGDALCESEAYDAQHYLSLGKVSSCNTEEDWKTTCDAINDDNVFTDPLYDSMKWAYELVNVEPVWRMGYTGKGIHVRINDDGVDGDHPEFGDRFDVANSCSDYLPTVADDSHGTACASLVGAEADNNACAVGMAPGVTLSACKATGEVVAPEPELFNFTVVDISSNSWGDSFCEEKEYRRRRSLEEEETFVCTFDAEAPDSPCEICEEDPHSQDCKWAITDYCINSENFEDHRLECAEFLDLFVDCTYLSMDPALGTAFGQNVEKGRGGLGTIIVFAAGNQHQTGENTNFDPLVSSRYTIGVAALGKDGEAGSYSNPGSTVLVSAPGGDQEFTSNNIVANPSIAGGGICTDATEGTSFACPTVSGIVALVLEACNNTLGWRDVQGILATTAKPIFEEDPTWTKNGAGLMHSDRYGYGVVDAMAAVNASINWVNFGPEQQIMVTSGDIRLPITNNESVSTEHNLLVEANGIVTESVAVYINMIHGSRGDLRVELTSPSGTKSILSPSDRPEFTSQTGEEAWKLVTVKNWYEDPNGNWTLKIVDADDQFVEACKDGSIQVNDLVYEDTVDDCNLIEQQMVCSDGMVNETQIYFAEADIEALATECCVCGGGEPLGDENILIDWTIIVYGHEDTKSEDEGIDSAISKTVP